MILKQTITIVISGYLLTACIAATAIDVATSVVGGAIDVTAAVAGGAIDLVGETVDVVVPGDVYGSDDTDEDEDKDKDRDKDESDTKTGQE